MNEARFQITDLSGKIVHEVEYTHEVSAHELFEEVEKIRSPDEWCGFTINASEGYMAGGCIGSIKVIVIDKEGNHYQRRELFRNA
jgi:hypothetical protein